MVPDCLRAALYSGVMPRIHFLNVGQGDCSTIEHATGHVTVIDVCNAYRPKRNEVSLLPLANRGVIDPFQQGQHPVNPIQYMRDRGIDKVFRFVLTHPDMDHMDGIKTFFEEFHPTNFWDTDNTCEKDDDFDDQYRFDEGDWEFYKKLRDGRPKANPTRLALHAGDAGPFYNRDTQGGEGGDGITILAPSRALVVKANECEEYNDSSYVLLYCTQGRKIIFAGDSHDNTWEHILATYPQLVRNVDLLIAPHHGRHSDRKYDFLDVLRPHVTLFGCAPLEHLRLEEWQNRDLSYASNNHAGSIVIDVRADNLSLLVSHRPFAQLYHQNPIYIPSLDAYYCSEFYRVAA
jgi:competence protein ComEC